MLEFDSSNHEQELAELEQIGNAGYILGLGLRFGKPDFLINRYPASWTERYEQENYFFGDPMTVWTMAKTGCIRWSECTLPDVRGVMEDAKNYGLVYGATFVEVVQNQRSFLSIGRIDRELTDSEMATLGTRLRTWANLFTNYWKSIQLSPAEIAALASIKSGANQDEAAQSLKISRSALRQRLTTAAVKLRAPNSVSAVARASQIGVI